MLKKLFFLCFIVVNCSAQQQVAVFFQASGQTQFAVDKVAKGLFRNGHRMAINPASAKAKNAIIFCTLNDEAWVKTKTNISIPSVETLEAEGFSIQRVKQNNATTIFVVGSDMAG